jgi:murein L,D-transpeptidase YcbB/YkuD
MVRSPRGKLVRSSSPGSSPSPAAYLHELWPDEADQTEMIKRVQTVCGLIVDGVAGPITLGALRSLFPLRED